MRKSIWILVLWLCCCWTPHVAGVFVDICALDERYFYTNNDRPEINVSVLAGKHSLIANQIVITGENQNITLTTFDPQEISRYTLAEYKFTIGPLQENQYQFFFNVTNEKGELFDPEGDKLRFRLEVDNELPVVTSYDDGEVIVYRNRAIEFEFSEAVRLEVLLDGESIFRDDTEYECLEAYSTGYFFDKRVVRTQTLEILLTDLAGNKNRQVFTLVPSGVPMTLELISSKEESGRKYFFDTTLPRYASFFDGTLFSRSNTFEVKVRTSKPALCKFSNSLLQFVPYNELLNAEDMDSSNNLEHTIDVQVGDVFEIACKAIQGAEIAYLNSLYKRDGELLSVKALGGDFSIEDLTPTTIATTSPVSVAAQTSQEAICNVTLVERKFYLDSDKFLRHSAVQQLGSGEYELNAICINRVGETETRKTTFELDTNALPRVVSYTPKFLISTTEQVLLTLSDDVECKYSFEEINPREYPALNTGNIVTRDGPLTRLLQTTFTEGKNIVYIYCVKNGQVSQSSIEVSVDSIGPQFIFAELMSTTGEKTSYAGDGTTFVTYEFNSSSGIEEYTLLFHNFNRTDEETTKDTEFLVPINYTSIEIRARDKFNRNASGEVFLQYDLLPPIVSVTEFDGSVDIRCQDDLSGCGAIYYGFSDVSLACTASRIHSNGSIAKGNNYGICAKGFDKAGNVGQTTYLFNPEQIPTNESTIPEELCEDETLDTDQDGMPDCWEKKHGLDPENPLDGTDDDDNDGISNLEEYKQGTNPKSSDTDGDGCSDDIELADPRFDPLDQSDCDPRKLDNNDDEELSPLPPQSEAEEEGSSVFLLLFVALVLIAGGGAIYYYYDQNKKNPFGGDNFGDSFDSQQFDRAFDQSAQNQSTRQSSGGKYDKVKTFFDQQHDEFQQMFKDFDNSKVKVAPKSTLKQEQVDLDQVGGKDVHQEIEDFEEYYKKKHKKEEE